MAGRLPTPIARSPTLTEALSERNQLYDPATESALPALANTALTVIDSPGAPASGADRLLTVRSGAGAPMVICVAAEKLLASEISAVRLSGSTAANTYQVEPVTRFDGSAPVDV